MTPRRSKTIQQNAQFELSKARTQLSKSADQGDAESPEYLAALLNGAIMLSRLGETEEGIALTNQYLEAAHRLLEAGSDRVYDGYKLLGVFADQLREGSDQRRATELDGRVLDFAISAFGETHINVAKALVNLAMDHAAEGDYSQAVDEMTRALRISNEKEKSERLSIRYVATLKNWNRLLGEGKGISKRI